MSVHNEMFVFGSNIYIQLPLLYYSKMTSVSLLTAEPMNNEDIKQSVSCLSKTLVHSNNLKICWDSDPQRMNQVFGEPMTFPLVPPSGQSFHMYTWNGQICFKFSNHKHTPNWINCLHFGQCYSSTTYLNLTGSLQ